jgi:hypothetical protein
MADAEENSRKSIGFMAQDVQPLFPELVHQNRDRETKEPFLMMDYSSFGENAIKAIQEQQIIINGLQSQIDELKNGIIRSHFPKHILPIMQYYLHLVWYGGFFGGSLQYQC